MSLRIRKFVCAALAALGFVTGMIALDVAAPAPVSAAGSYCWTGSTCPVYNGPSARLHYFEAPRGTAVRMLCWKDAEWHKVNYWSNRWFKVTTPYTSTAWMHSSEVYNQTSVPRC